MTWVSFDEIKKKITLGMAIDHYRVSLRRVAADVLRGKCPLPMHGSEKSKDSFTATLSKGTGGVWACQSQSCIAARGGRRGGNALDFVAAMERCSVRDAAIKMTEWSNAPGDSPYAATQPVAAEERSSQTPPERSQREQPQSKPDERAGESEEPNRPLGFTLRGIDRNHPYLASRGLNRETLDTFGVGFFPGKGSMAGRVAIPIHNGKGELVAYAGRSVDQKEPKYKLPAGFRKSEELFNFHRADEIDTSTVVVVEGFFDAMTVHQAGFPAVVALMGCACSHSQEALLVERFECVVLMLDGDEPGREAQHTLTRQLASRCFVRTATVPDGKQPDQLSADEIKNILQAILR
jgi:DNA primase